MADFSSYKLKENYKLCEYIESTTNDTGPYIDTGWTFTKPGQTDIIVDCATTDCAFGRSWGGCFLGSRQDTENGSSIFSITVGYDADPHWRINEQNISSIPATLYKPMKFKFNKNNKWMYNGVEYGETPDVQINTFALFGMHSSSQLYSRSARIYRFIVIENNRLVRHMVPVIDSTNKPGMYDLVTNTFFTNANTSSTVDFSYKLKHEQLPYGYKACEWIESLGGGPYIDTGWKFDMSKVTDLTVHLSTAETSSANYFIGSANGTEEENKTEWCYVGTGNNKWLINGSFVSSSYMAINTNEKYRLNLRNHLSSTYPEYGLWIIDGKLPTFMSITQSCNFILFGVNNGGTPLTTYTSNVRIYDFKVEENGYLVRDMVPCLNQNNEPGMYDRVHGKFYGNANASATKEFNYQLKDQPLPSNLRRVGWIQSSMNTANDVPGYINLNTITFDEHTGFELLSSVSSNKSFTNNDSNLLLTEILSLGRDAGVWYTLGLNPHHRYAAVHKGAGKFNNSSSNIPYIVSCNMYDSHTGTSTESTQLDTTTGKVESATTTLMDTSKSVTLSMFLLNNYFVGDEITVKIYDAKITEYNRLEHHYIPCIDVNKENAPCMFDLKTGEVFYEAEDSTITSHLTWGY